ncbi:MAG: PepSY domain-containing protein [Oscillospiraceae bacterium]|jgi:hypothetical protein|nr:PepSY domain-containing protein [Oscillospiraceae bacterium]
MRKAIIFASAGLVLMFSAWLFASALNNGEASGASGDADVSDSVPIIPLLSSVKETMSETGINPAPDSGNAALRSFEAVSARFGTMEKLPNGKYKGGQYRLSFENGRLSGMVLMYTDDTEKLPEVNLSETEVLDKATELFVEYGLSLNNTTVDTRYSEGASDPWAVTVTGRDERGAIILQCYVHIDSYGRIGLFMISEQNRPSSKSAVLSREDAIETAVRAIVAENGKALNLNADEVLKKQAFTVTSADLYALADVETWQVVIDGLKLTDEKHIHTWFVTVDAVSGEISSMSPCR